MTVRVDWPALEEEWDDADGGDFLWELALDVPGDVVELVDQAIDAVNAVLDPVPGPGGPSSERATETARGAAALMRPYGEPADVQAWYDALARRLGESGISGRLGPARPDPRPDWLEAPPGSAVPTAILAWDVPPDEDTPPGWGPAPEDAEATVATVLAWLDRPGATSFLTRYLFTDELPGGAAPADLAGPLRRALARTFTTTLAQVTGPGQGRIAAWEAPGLLTLQVAGAEDVPVAVDELVGLVRALGPGVRLASVRPAPVPTRGWRSTAGLPPVSPSWDPARLGTQEDRMDQLPALRRGHVVDAYGVQVLTDAHLARVPRPPAERWQIEPLGAGRHLVVARDRAAWFTPTGPDAAALEAARADLRALLLTPASTA